MSYPERAALAVALFLLSAVLLDGCKTHLEQEARSDSAVADTLEQQGTLIEERTTTAPIRIVTETTTATGIKRTRTVTLAPVATSRSSADLKSQERQDTTLSSESKLERTRDLLHSPFAWIGALVALAGLVYGALKLRKVIP